MSMIFAPGERHVVAHRPSGNGTRCGLPVNDGWQTLPPELSTPMCAECTDSPQTPEHEAPQALEEQPATETPSVSQEPPQPTPAAPQEPPPAAQEKAPQDEAPPLPHAPTGVPLVWRVLAWLRTLRP
ncbi:hypothetical protein [Nonomuraea sp. 10N515B]|uniref:hypothetical protein n=1 Tax=Nonomuraea sp. 10N515B TaxID=3457422 RepID=UPI003FCC9334